MQNEFLGAFEKLRLAFISLVIFIGLSVRTSIVYFIMRPLKRPRRRWKDNIKMDVDEVGWACADRMKLTQDTDKWQHL
jgi:hypothetical protein